MHADVNKREAVNTVNVVKQEDVNVVLILRPAPRKKLGTWGLKLGSHYDIHDIHGIHGLFVTAL
jgi:hypothetical protein